MRLLAIAALQLSLVLGAFGQTVNIVNLTTITVDGAVVSNSGVTDGTGASVIGGFLNGTFFRRTLASDNFGSGSGAFRDLYRVQDNSTSTNPEDGYNRAVFPDVSIPGGFSPNITVANLSKSVEGDSYIFAFDTHENTGGNNRYISLDDVRIYVGGTTDPGTLPTSVATLSSLGTLVYAMNQTGQQNNVLIDSSLYSGSGQMDAFMCVPAPLFAGFDQASLVYIYTSWGQYSTQVSGRMTGFDTSATPEDVAMQQQAFASYVSVPEPSGAVLLAAAAVVALLARSRRRPRA